MTFDVTTELLLDGTWTDITADVYQRDSIQVVRGRSDEATSAEPSHCNLTLNNRTGKYSPRNPTGTYYGVIGRNTPLRVLAGTSGSNYMALPGRTDVYGSTVSCAYTPDVAALDITGDIDIRVDVEPQTWRPAGRYGLAQKWVNSPALELSTGNTFSKSWTLWIAADGHPTFRWTADESTEFTQRSTAAVPSTSGRLSVRVTLDVDNGATGHAVRFYTAPTLGGTYTQLGTTITTAGVTSIFSGTADVEVGRATPDTDALLQGKVYGAEVRNGIGGSAVAAPDFTARDTGDTTFADAQARTWTLRGRAVMANPGTRFHGEVSAWPVRWDKAETDVYVPVEAYGPLRRLGQGSAPLKSVMYRHMTSLDNVVAYWPCEDGEDAEEFASALPGYPSMLHPSGETTNSSYDGFKASEPLALASLVQWTGNVPAYTTTGSTQVRFLMNIPASGVASTATVCRVRTAGTAPRWDLTVTTAGSLRLQAYNSEDVSIADSGVQATAVNGKRLMVSIELEHLASDVNWDVRITEVGTESVTTFGGSLLSRTVVRAIGVAMNVGGVMDDVALGHITVQDEITPILTVDHNRLLAYKGEHATDRIIRLCEEEGVPVTIIGIPDDSAELGWQLPMSLLDLLREAADADLGILYEPREFLGLAYRTRASLYAQDAALTLDYSAGEVADIEPTEDDDDVVNDITVANVGGSSARAVLESGSLSVNPPPDGIGRYDDEVTISLQRDVDLSDQASWRLHKGTVDEARYPVLGVNLGSPAFTGDATLTANAQGLDVGDRVVVENPPAWLPPEDIQQLAQGFTETLDPYVWLIDINCTPASPWDVAVWDDSSGPGEARYSSDGSTLSAGVTSSATSLSIATPTGPLWSGADQPFDIMIGGERMTVTAVTGTSSPQTFTVTRSVNGITKSHAAGAEVDLYKPGRFAL